MKSVAKSVSGLVLCGGQSARMGRDKALLELNGKPLLQLQIERLVSAGCSEILVSGPKSRGYERFGRPVIEDTTPDAGPIAGLFAGFEAATTPLILILAIDLPHLRMEFLQYLITRSSNHDAVCPKSENFLEPLCALYRRDTCLPLLRKHLARGQKSLQDFLKDLQFQGSLQVIPPREWQVFGTDLLHNWNEPEK